MLTDGDLERAKEILDNLGCGYGMGNSSIEFMVQILAAERRRTLELAEVKALVEVSEQRANNLCALQPYALSCNDPNPKAIWCFPCKARKALENFHKLLSETKGDNGK